MAFILVLLAVLSLVGCGSSGVKLPADQVVQRAFAAQSGLSTSHVEITENATARGIWGGSTLNASLNGTGSSDIDSANKKMKAHLSTNMDYNGHPFPVSADVYMVDNYSYTQITIASMTGDWSKSLLPADFWLTTDNMQFIDSILQSTQAESLPDEKVSGIDCYVVQLTPDIAATQQMLSRQSIIRGDLPDMASLISDLSFRVWVAKDTSYFTKIEMALSARVTPQSLGKTTNGDAIDITLSLIMQPTDLNKPVSIELPAQGGLSTNHAEITGNASVQGTWSGSPLNAGLSGTVSGDVDWAKERIKAQLRATPSLYGIAFPISADMYVVDNYSYTQMTIASVASDWSRTVLPADFWPGADDIRLLGRILQHTQAKSLPDEKVAGTDCFVVQLTPDIAAVQQMLSQQSVISGEFPNLANVINSLSFKVWVAKDTSHFTKIEMALSAHVTPEALGKTANGDALDIALSVTMRITDFNKPVSIELPAGAHSDRHPAAEADGGSFG